MKKCSYNFAYIFYFHFLCFLFYSNFIRSSRVNDLNDFNNNNRIDKKQYTNDVNLNTDFVDKEFHDSENNFERNKDINSKNRIKEQEEKIKLNFHSFLQKYKASLLKDISLFNIKEGEEKKIKEAENKIEIDKTDTYITKDQQVGKKEKSIEYKRSMNKTNNEQIKLQNNFLNESDGKSLNSESEKLKKIEQIKIEKEKKLIKSNTNDINIQNTLLNEPETEFVNNQKVDNETKSKYNKFIKIDENGNKNLNKEIEANFIQKEFSINEFEKGSLHKEKMNSSVSKEKRRIKFNTNNLSKNIQNLIFNNFLDAKIDLKILKGSKQLRYFENLKSKINISQNDLEVIFNGNPKETKKILKNSIVDFGSLLEENIMKFSFNYRFIEKCENFIFNKESFSNYKAKDYNSFNNMFLNNEDHEDNNSEENPNYDEKPFENEFYTLSNFNFYIHLNFKFLKSANKNNPINRLLNSEEENAKEYPNSRFLSKNEKEKVENNSYSKRDENEENYPEILNILIKLNFNHKNNNGDIFLKFFIDLNNEKLQNRNQSKTFKNSSSFLQIDTSEEEFDIEALTNKYLEKNTQENSDLNKKSQISKKEINRKLGKIESKKDITEDPLDKDEYYIKNLEKKYAELTIKEKKFFFLKFINSVVFQSCQDAKSEANDLKENLRKILTNNFLISQNITNLQNDLSSLEKKKTSLANLYKESENLHKEKASFENLELKQIKSYKKIIEKIDKSFIRDGKLIQIEEEILYKKLTELEKEKNLYNKTQSILISKQTQKENLEFDIEFHNNLITKTQADLLENNYILKMVNSDKQNLKRKFDFQNKRISKNKNSVINLKQKINDLNSQKNSTEMLIENNLNRKIKIFQSLDDDNKKIEEIEKKIKQLLAEKNNILEQKNIKNEDIDKIETENLAIENNFILIKSNLTFLINSLDEKNKNLENSHKNLNQIKSELEKMKNKENIFTYHFNDLNSTIFNHSSKLKDCQNKYKILSNEINQLNLKQKSMDVKLLGMLDEINIIQTNLNKYNANINTNKIYKRNYQVDMKNTIDNLIKEKVLDENVRYYEYFDDLEKNEKIRVDSEKSRKTGNYKNLTDIFNYNTYKIMKHQFFESLISKENSKYNNSLSSIEIKINLNGKILLNRTNKISENITDEIYSEYDSEKNFKNKLNANLLDDYIVIDYDRLFKKISKNKFVLNLFKAKPSSLLFKNKSPFFMYYRKPKIIISKIKWGFRYL